MDKPKLVVIVGPTAVGKSRLALGLAETMGGEIISADSRQVYKLMDIGTAKPSRSELKRINHHLIDLIYPDELFDVARYRSEAAKVIEDVIKRGKKVIVAGGTGLYIRALTRGLFQGPRADFSFREQLKREIEVLGNNCVHDILKEVDPSAAIKIHPRDTMRIIRALEVYYITGKPLSKFHQEHNFSDTPYRVLKIGLKMNRETLNQKIDERADRMIAEGLINEVKSLLKKGYAPNLPAFKTLGYKHIFDYVLGDKDLDESISLIKRDTKRYAKRQITWFKQDREIYWFNPVEKERIYQFINEIVSHN